MKKQEEKVGVAIIVAKKDEILLGKRKGGYMPSTMGVPGGRTEVGESLEEAARRELKEETDLNAKLLEYIGVVREDQRDYIFVHFVFKTDKFSGKIKNMEPEKCEGWEWHGINNLPENILRGHSAAINLFVKNENLKDLV